MTYIKAAILGLVQGFAEFLPISSSGHLALLQQWFDIEGDSILLFAILLHAGTLISVLVIYWKDIWELIVEFVKMIGDLLKGKGARINEYPMRRFALLIIVASIPTGIMGLFLEDFFNSLYTSLLPIGIGFIITGIILVIAEKTKNSYKSVLDMSFTQALFVGLIQGCAIAPGISRSGSTLFASLISKLDRDFAVKFVFILSIPPILGSLVLEVPEAISEGVSGLPIGPIIFGMIIAMVSGFIAIKTMIKVVSKKKLSYFSVYLWILGLFVIGYSLYIGIY